MKREQFAGLLRPEGARPFDITDAIKWGKIIEKLPDNLYSIQLAGETSPRLKPCRAIVAPENLTPGNSVMLVKIGTSLFVLGRVF